MYSLFSLLVQEIHQLGGWSLYQHAPTHMDWWTNSPLNSLAGYLRINSLRMSISKPTPKVCTLLDLFSYESCCHFMQPFLEKRTHSDSFLWWSFIVYLLFIYLYFLQDGVNPTTGWLWKSQKQPWWVILVEREGADTMMNLTMTSQICEIPWKVAWSDLGLPGQNVETHIFKQRHVSIF